MTLRLKIFLSSFIIAILAVSFSPRSTVSIGQFFSTRLQRFKSLSSHPSIMASRMPTYFFSHGGPNVQHEPDHPAYAELQSIGREITSLNPPPRAIAVISAHWEASPISVNVAKSVPLIYDFYGFPDKYYKATFPHHGDPKLANRILRLLKYAGITAKGVKRGLDHGVWSGFSVAFHPDSNPLGDVPIVQISLYPNEDPEQHLALGRALAPLRDEGVLIIGAGMSVHNLRDLGVAFSKPEIPMPYSVTFDEALRDAVLANPTEREEMMKQIVHRRDARQAHPTMDHLMPLYVAAGAAGNEEEATRVWTFHEASFAWAQYRFGDPTGGKLLQESQCKCAVCSKPVNQV